MKKRGETKQKQQRKPLTRYPEGVIAGWLSEDMLDGCIQLLKQSIKQ